MIDPKQVKRAHHRKRLQILLEFSRHHWLYVSVLIFCAVSFVYNMIVFSTHPTMFGGAHFFYAFLSLFGGAIVAAAGDNFDDDSEPSNDLKGRDNSK